MTFSVPAVADTALGDRRGQFTDAAGAPVDIETAGAPSRPGHPCRRTTTTSAASSRLAAPAPPRALTLTYTSDPAIDAQVGYVLDLLEQLQLGAVHRLERCRLRELRQPVAHRARLGDGRRLVLRRAPPARCRRAGRARPRMRDWLLSRPDLATPLDDSQRGAREGRRHRPVRLGPLGRPRPHRDRHAREHTRHGHAVWVGGHTKDADYWDVDEALATGGGSVTYFSLEERSPASRDARSSLGHPVRIATGRSAQPSAASTICFASACTALQVLGPLERLGVDLVHVFGAARPRREPGVVRRRP